MKTAGDSRRKLLVRGVLGAGAIAFGGMSAWSAGDAGVTHKAEAIHQEPVFHASAERLYNALTDARQFDKVMRLSEAMRSMATGTAAAEIGKEAGGSFSLFGGYVTGRHIELVPNRRIVQAWRPQSWDSGVYSVVRFELTAQGNDTRIVFDHRGFPDGTGAHLAEGWESNYWTPLREYLGSPQ
jgi:activator of HSP90 ATPase